MKKLLILGALALLPCLIHAQTNMPVLIDTASYSMAEQYCIVTPVYATFSNKISLDIDYGQDPNADKRLRGEHHKEIKFNSVAQALNHMAYSGWLFVNAIKTDGHEYSSYLLRRPVKQSAGVAAGN